MPTGLMTVGVVGDDLDLDAFGVRVALEARIDWPWSMNLSPLGCRFGRRLLEIEIEFLLAGKWCQCQGQKRCCQQAGKEPLHGWNLLC